jgi:hypothetical protein
VFLDNQAAASGSGLCVEQGAALLLHNTFAANHGGDGSGVFITGTLSAVTATNTIVAGHAQGVVVTGGASALLDHTLWYGNSADHVGAVTHTADLFGDPAFSADGYHLLPQSPAVNSGVDAGVNVDIDGERRPSRGGFDIGADEYGIKLFLPLVVRGYHASP